MATAINSSLQDTQEHSGYPSISIFRQEVNHKLKIITAWFSWLFVATTTLRSYAIGTKGLFILPENVCLNVNATIKVSHYSDKTLKMMQSAFKHLQRD